MRFSDNELKVLYQALYELDAQLMYLVENEELDVDEESKYRSLSKEANKIWERIGNYLGY